MAEILPLPSGAAVVISPEPDYLKADLHLWLASQAETLARGMRGAEREQWLARAETHLEWATRWGMDCRPAEVTQA